MKGVRKKRILNTDKFNNNHQAKRVGIDFTLNL